MFKGSGVAIVTPFHKNQVNYQKLEELINWHVEQSTDAIIICGTTGESPTLSKEEKKQVIAFAVEKTAKRIPVIAGTGGNDTKEAIDMSIFAEQVGADGLLVVTPYYNKATQKGLLTHFIAIADAVNIPIILYNVPGRTGVNINPETVATLEEHKNIVGIKEASGDISQVAKIANLCSKDFAILSGNDDQIVPTLSLGGVGVISVVANILPKETHDMVYLFLEGQTQKSLELQLKMLNLINSLFIEVNPIPVKAAMNMMGMEVGNLRLPLTEMEEQTKVILKNELKPFGLVD
ncbi:4-hydroxy-tetrahydrodipicolinate synthase [Alkalicella caledoniensis]|uniref:4-hydroxy-tetrahydrodipicolinate synthase n=1 Tax=Alkalicella caledoniensis TaxID=2731377 RepID=A0A7G9W440_ALKCA|nr:4-hydroxy-tetrahydrodipicolinate synthase [Alkalicella caledoniensis]QNO13452.1 4-hydroxy-tetrahydrodipicolinate synthase [Alkalicella caledoniensis]